MGVDSGLEDYRGIGGQWGKVEDQTKKSIFEIGSGPHVQSIRKKTRMLGIKYNADIIRINPKDYKIKEPHIGINKGALEALLEIEAFINKYKNKRIY